MPARLAALGFVDEAFPRYAAMARWELRCRGPGEEALLAADLRLPQVAHGAAGG
jgi:hypothetical protein